MTVRQIYYSLVGAGKLDKTEQAYARLGEHLNRARRAKVLPFDAIRDDGVMTMHADYYGSVADFRDDTARRAREYRRDRQAGQPQRLELWSEAAGMVGQLARVAEDFSVPVYSASGFASLSAVRTLANRALRSSVPTVMLHVGDYDPSGESIFAAIAEDASAFVREDRTVQTTRLDAIRVALTREQVDVFSLPTSPVKASDGRSRGWDGGTCQLEALPPDMLAALVRDAIEDTLDVHRYREEIRREHLDRAELLGLPSGGPVG
ncbi:MAG: hypothetical protein WKF94_05380 [Solirubrobacteraceae bacterium]